MTMVTARLDTLLAPNLNPMDSVVVLQPEAPEAGYWVGCASVLHEPDKDRFVLTYRQRRPRGHSDGDRGWRCAVAVSSDGVNFTDVWSVRKEEMSSPSMERFSLIPQEGGGYQLYISYVDPADNRWRIDVVEAAEVDGFDIHSRREVLTAASSGTEGVKDPYLLRRGPVTYLIASYAEKLASGSAAEAHATADIYNVGATTHPTGLATSVDGRRFTWHGQVMAVGESWDCYQARINSVVPLGGGGYLGFYDGSSSHEENYEERTGLAVSPDLFTWHRLTLEGPWTVVPHTTGSVRYVDAHLIKDQWWIWFETTRADGAHELRLARRPIGQ